VTVIASREKAEISKQICGETRSYDLLLEESERHTENSHCIRTYTKQLGLVYLNSHFANDRRQRETNSPAVFIPFKENMRATRSAC
jgi:hypothetical protein